MTVGDALSYVFNLIKGFMTIEIPVGEFRITFWQVFIFIAVIGLFLKLFFGFGGGKTSGD